MTSSLADVEQDVAAFLVEAAAPRDREIGGSGGQGARRPRVELPRYDEREGLWRGGDNRTLYAYTDRQSGNTFVFPGGVVHYMEPDTTVRVATRDEAERLWQRPLQSGWKVA